VQRRQSKEYIEQTKSQMRQYLQTFNRSNGVHRYSEIEVMKWFIIKERLICSELNKLNDGGDKILAGLFWCPRKYQDILY
jgi:hypothetical protein